MMIKSTQPLKMEPSLIVVTDAGGHVTAIWKAAERRQFAKILQEEGL